MANKKQTTKATKAKARSAKKPATKSVAKSEGVKLSCLDAAAQVLKGQGEPMTCKAMVELMAERKLWATNAPTPAATLSSAILREMKKGSDSRFKKTGRGLFAFSG
jgi:hypothetical protein